MANRMMAFPLGALACALVALISCNGVSQVVGDESIDNIIAALEMGALYAMERVSNTDRALLNELRTNISQTSSYGTNFETYLKTFANSEDKRVEYKTLCNKFTSIYKKGELEPINQAAIEQASAVALDEMIALDFMCEALFPGFLMNL